MGVVDELGGFVDEEADVFDGFAPSGVETGAVEGGLSGEVAVAEGPDGGVGGGDGLESTCDVGGAGGMLGGAGEDEGLGGAEGGAPGFFGGVTGVSGGELPEGGVVHGAGVGEDGWGVGCGGGHGWGIIARGWGHPTAPRGMDSRLLGNDGLKGRE